MATIDKPSVNDPNDRDPHNNNSFGTLVDSAPEGLELPVLNVEDFNERIIRSYESGGAEKSLEADLSVA